MIITQNDYQSVLAELNNLKEANTMDKQNNISKMASFTDEIKDYKIRLAKEKNSFEENMRKMEEEKTKQIEIININNKTAIQDKIKEIETLKLQKPTYLQNDETDVNLHIHYENDNESTEEYELFRSQQARNNELDKKALDSIQLKSAQIQLKMDEQIAMYETIILKKNVEKEDLQKLSDKLEGKAREYDVTNSKLTSTLKSQLVTMKHLESANEALKEKVYSLLV